MRNLKIKNKHESTKLFARGSFGNYVRQWDHIDKVPCYVMSDSILCRRSLVPNDQVIYYANQETERWNMARETFVKGRHYWNEQINGTGAEVIFQGEVMRRAGGSYELYYSLKDLPMRTALATFSRNASGIKALILMRHLCCSRGFDCIMANLDKYSGDTNEDSHVVEFTTFDRVVGALGWRSVIWEVRNF